MSADILPRGSKNVLHQKGESVPVAEVVQIGRCQKQITKKKIELLAIQKYGTNGKGVTIEDLTTTCSVKNSKAQRSLKYFHSIGILFTAQDLIRLDISILQKMNPKEYFVKNFWLVFYFAGSYVPSSYSQYNVALTCRM